MPLQSRTSKFDQQVDELQTQFLATTHKMEIASYERFRASLGSYDDHVAYTD